MVDSWAVSPDLTGPSILGGYKLCALVLCPERHMHASIHHPLSEIQISLYQVLYRYPWNVVQRSRIIHCEHFDPCSCPPQCVTCRSFHDNVGGILVGTLLPLSRGTATSRATSPLKRKKRRGKERKLQPMINSIPACWSPAHETHLIRDAVAGPTGAYDSSAWRSHTANTINPCFRRSNRHIDVCLW